MARVTELIFNVTIMCYYVLFMFRNEILHSSRRSTQPARSVHQFILGHVMKIN